MHLTNKVRKRSLWRVFDDGAADLRPRILPQPAYGSVIAAAGEAAADQVGAALASGVASAAGAAANDMVGSSS